MKTTRTVGGVIVVFAAVVSLGQTSGAPLVPERAPLPVHLHGPGLTASSDAGVAPRRLRREAAQACFGGNGRLDRPATDCLRAEEIVEPFDASRLSVRHRFETRVVMLARRQP